MLYPSIQIAEAEYQERVQRLLAYLHAEKLSGVLLFDNYYIQYYTGFAFIPTERPIVYLINDKGEKVLFVPRLELEHAETNACVDRVEYYTEYPYQPHPIQVLKKIMGSQGIQGDYGADQDGYPWILGFHGPDLAELTGVKPKRVSRFIEEQLEILTYYPRDLGSLTIPT